MDIPQYVVFVFYLGMLFFAGLADNLFHDGGWSMPKLLLYSSLGAAALTALDWFFA